MDFLIPWIIYFCLSIVVAFFVYKKSRDTSLSILLFMVTALAFFLATILASKAFVPLEQYTVRSEELIAIRDGTGIHGSFLLGSGTIKGVNYYYFYYKTRDGGFKQGWVPAASTVVYEKSEYKDKGRMDVFNKRIPVNSFWKYLIAFPVNPPGSQQWKIYVPPETIIKEFRMDLK